MDEAAKKWVTDALRSSIPKHIPLPFIRVIAARFLARKRKTAAASLEMVDGRIGRIAVWKWIEDLPDAWAYRWLESAPGILIWNGKQWVRDNQLYVNIPDSGQIEMLFEQIGIS